MKDRILNNNEELMKPWIAEEYDQIMRESRDKGQLYTNKIINFGISSGKALEIGPGPGYLGLEWLKTTQGTTLIGIDISFEMVKIAEMNAAAYGFSDSRVKYFQHSATQLPFEDKTFDSLFTNASLHEWKSPEAIFNEIYRVLQPGGLYFISDLRRDMNPIIKFMMKKQTKNREMKEGLISSINEAYTKNELHDLLQKTKLTSFEIVQNPFSLFVKGIK